MVVNKETLQTNINKLGTYLKSTLVKNMRHSSACTPVQQWDAVFTIRMKMMLCNHSLGLQTGTMVNRPF